MWGAGFLLSGLARTSAERRASVTVQPGVRVRPRGLSLQGAVPEPQEQDPLFWVWPGPQVVTDLPMPPGNTKKGHSNGGR